MAESVMLLQRSVNKLDSLCERREFKVIVDQSKVTVFKTAREQTVTFGKSHRAESMAK